jgi:hypothetical protein
MARERKDARAATYAGQAQALRQAIERRFWREDRGLYMSWVGPSFMPMPVESYDLLGTALAITSGVASKDHATRALSNYPVADAGSPVIWPQQPATAIYHNRAIWPFVSAYALRAARTNGDGARIAHEIRSLMRGAALAGSNMENYELVTQAVHVDDGAFSGPVVNSPRQLWSVAGIPRHGAARRVRGGGRRHGAAQAARGARADAVRRSRHDRPGIAGPSPHRAAQAAHAGGWVARGRATTHRRDDHHGRPGAGRRFPQTPFVRTGAAFAPAVPAAPKAVDTREGFEVALEAGTRLYVDGKVFAHGAATALVPKSPLSQCMATTRVADGLESLPSPTVCVGPRQTVSGKVAARLDRADDGSLSGGAPLPQRQWPGEHRHHRRRQNPGARLRRHATDRHDRLPASRRRGHLDRVDVRGEGGRTMPFPPRGRHEHERSRAFRALHRRQGRRKRPLKAADIGVLTLMPAR